MSSQPPPDGNHPQATGLMTPGGARILVLATPPPLPQNDASTLAQAPVSAYLAPEPVTPLEIDDTLEHRDLAHFLGDVQYGHPESPLHNDNGADAQATTPQQFVFPPPSNPAQIQSAFQQLHLPVHVLAHYGLVPHPPHHHVTHTTVLPLDDQDLGEGQAGVLEDAWPNQTAYARAVTLVSTIL